MTVSVFPTTGEDTAEVDALFEEIGLEVRCLGVHAAGGGPHHWLLEIETDTITGFFAALGATPVGGLGWLARKLWLIRKRHGGPGGRVVLRDRERRVSLELTDETTDGAADAFTEQRLKRGAYLWDSTANLWTPPN
ncbi:MAG: hypothetical protein QOG99_3599 [Frankiales bacterium]|nr:hypothetical protein [Frankiales bacterium]